MIVSVVACGESASEWYKTPCDLSIGVNDSSKWGHSVNQLLLINSPFQFEKSRLEVIKNTKFDKVLTHSDNWQKIFQNYEKINLQSFGRYAKKGRVYSSKTSPFVAMSLAFNYGASDIILHGVDMVNHRVFNPNNRARTESMGLYNYELRNFELFAKIMADQGTKVWLGKDYGALTKILNVWVKV